MIEMCIAFPGRVVAIDAAGAVVETNGRLRRASMLYLPGIAIGDWVTVAAGTIIERLDAADAAAIHDLVHLATVSRPPSEEASDVPST